MTHKNKQEEKRRREKLLHDTSQANGRPMDNVDEAFDSRIFEPFNHDCELPPIYQRPANRLSFKWLAFYLLFAGTVLALILYLDAPYRQKQEAQDKQDAILAVGHALAQSDSLTARTSGKVVNVASNNDDYPNVQRRRVMSNIFPTRYLTLRGSHDRYYISRWVMFVLSDDDLKNAASVEIEYDPRPKTRPLMFDKKYRYFSVSSLTVNGKSYYTPTTTMGIKDNLIVLFVFSLMCVVFLITRKRSSNGSQSE